MRAAWRPTNKVPRHAWRPAFGTSVIGPRDTYINTLLAVSPLQPPLSLALAVRYRYNTFTVRA
jgi:hypothetical protein